MDVKQFLATEIAKLPKKRDDKESFLNKGDGSIFCWVLKGKRSKW